MVVVVVVEPWCGQTEDRKGNGWRWRNGRRRSKATHAVKAKAIQQQYNYETMQWSHSHGRQAGRLELAVWRAAILPINVLLSILQWLSWCRCELLVRGRRFKQTVCHASGYVFSQSDNFFVVQHLIAFAPSYGPFSDSDSQRKQYSNEQYHVPVGLGAVAKKFRPNVLVCVCGQMAK